MIIDPDYARIFTKARLLAWTYGYSCCVQGSLTRDLDLLLTPWTEQARPEALSTIVTMLAESEGLKINGEPSEKPHGRRAWTLLFSEPNDPRFVDVSGFLPDAHRSQQEVVPEPVALTDEREAFENWCKDERIHLKGITDFARAWARQGWNGRAALAASQPAPVYMTTPEQNAEVDEKLGIELLPPIRVSVTTAGIMKRFAALEGVILQAFVREVLEHRFTAGGVPVEASTVPFEQAWRDYYESKGYQYSGSALEKVRMGYELAQRVASAEVQTVPDAWQVWSGIGEMQPVWPPFKTRKEAEMRASMIKSNTEVRPMYATACFAQQGETK